MAHLFVALQDNASASDWTQLRETLQMIGFGSQPVGTVPTPVVAQPQSSPEPIPAQPTQPQPQPAPATAAPSNGDKWFPGMVINDHPDAMAKGRIARQAYRAFRAHYGREATTEERNALKAGHKLVPDTQAVTQPVAVSGQTTQPQQPTPSASPQPHSDRMAAMMARVQANLTPAPAPQPAAQPQPQTGKAPKRTVRFVTDITDDEAEELEEWMAKLATPAKAEAVALWLAGQRELSELSTIAHRNSTLAAKIANKLGVNIG